MPAISVSLNGTHLATVSTDGLHFLNFHAHGSVIQSELACIDLSGTMFEEEKESKHLTWIGLREIEADDEVAIALLEHGDTTFPGKTIAEMYPEDESVPVPVPVPAPSIEDMLTDLRQRPKTRDRFTFLVATPNDATITARTEPTDHSFGFSVLWDWTRPERARVSLSSNSLENIVKRTGGTEHVRFFLQSGESIKLRIGN